MSLAVTITENPVQVQVTSCTIAVNLLQNNVAVTIAQTGPQGPPGPAGGGITWNEVTGPTQMASGNGYVANNASRVILTLPPSADFGDIIAIAGKGAGGWSIQQNDGQAIHFDGNTTTTGTAGYLQSQTTFDCLQLLCITPSTNFLVTSSIGNITGN